MRCTSDMVNDDDDGREVHFKKTDCPLVEHWAGMYNARVKVKWISGAGGCLLLDPDYTACGSEWKKGDTVWAASSLIMGASRDAHLIKRLVSTTSMQEYGEIRQSLSKFGYPDNVLDAVPSPE